MVVLWPFIETSVALIFGCILGVSGVVDGVDTTGPGAVFVTNQHSVIGGISMGEIAIAQPQSVLHEQGHIEWYRDVGVIGLPIAALSSGVGFLLAMNGVIDARGYHQIYTERIAEAYANEH